MRDRDRDGTEAVHCTPNAEAMNLQVGVPALSESMMHKAMNSDLSVIAAHLIEAACRAREGDREAASEYIGHAAALLYGKFGFEPTGTRSLSKMCADSGNKLQTKRLRAGAVHELRTVPVDRGPQIFPFLENPCDVPTIPRSLSRREAGILQMISRGMSNKCIAKSLGIAPETVKTHVKAILRKLKARTRAQAVAHAADPQ